MHSSRGCTAPEGECIYFSHIPSNRVIAIMYRTLVHVVESIVGVKEVPGSDENQ